MDDKIDRQIGDSYSRERFGNALQKGKRFFRRSEIATILGISYYQVKYMIDLYRLDAFLIGNEYRVHWTAIAEYLDSLEEIMRQYLDLLLFAVPREISNFWDIRDLMSNGCQIEQVRTLLEGRNVKDWIIWNIAGRKLPNKFANAEEKVLRDWYDIPSMDLPFVATCREWASLLRVKPAVIGQLPDSEITYPEMYDWLVERECINRPIFQPTIAQEQKKAIAL